ncbi:hypothetical protein E2C01_013658 [Portunus trituberculatus]|uniref:Uncharacterized protein n=1 Tax=Portunus trituberculatus TaxID=210409 RepID=A0A5B7DHT0_PORTR|nr:hypothetical protein [Portunus trituberculatus]
MRAVQLNKYLTSLQRGTISHTVPLLLLLSLHSQQWQSSQGGTVAVTMVVMVDGERLNVDTSVEQVLSACGVNGLKFEDGQPVMNEWWNYRR